MIKVIIIGQDPYIYDNQADGLAFSVGNGKKPPPSLKNIFLELKSDVLGFELDKTGGCSLKNWTQQGVFLLNSILTVEALKPASHSNIGWQTFTDKVIKLISEEKEKCVFLLWGSYAQKKEKLIDLKKHHVIKSPHPSPNSIEKFEPNWSIQNYLKDETWKILLKEEFEKEYFVNINEIIKDGYERNVVMPPKELVFRAFNLTKFEDVSVIIIGQDPYHKGQADGLAFSTSKEKKPPRSLVNIFSECKNDMPYFERDENLGGSLENWATNGVFLLNAFLTVEAYQALSHSRIGWARFTDEIIRLISDKKEHCVFMLWGNFAKKKEPLIDPSKHKILKSSHPSPYSARISFLGSRCFSQANTFLRSVGKKEINW